MTWKVGDVFNPTGLLISLYMSRPGKYLATRQKVATIPHILAGDTFVRFSSMSDLPIILPIKPKSSVSPTAPGLNSDKKKKHT